MPGRVPIIIGCCFSRASVKNPTTQVPSTRNDGVVPKPCIDGLVTGCMTVAQGKSAVGMSSKSSVWNPRQRTRTRPNLSGSLRSSTTPVNQTKPSRPIK